MKKGKRNLILMTGTPLAKPEDAYGYLRLIAPEIYPTKAIFNAAHIAGRDYFDNPTGYKNEDGLNFSFMTNGARVFRREIDKDLPPVTYEPIMYDLYPEHWKVYKQIAEEAVKQLETKEVNGRQMVTAIQHSAVFNTLQQVVIGLEHYVDTHSTSVDKVRKQVAAFELLDSVVEALGERKLIVYAYYQKSISAITEYCQKYGAVQINGGLTAKQREENLDRFVNDPHCQILVGQPLSMGSGLDMLKDVCSDILFLELPTTANDFIQAVGRIDRNGQQERCHVRLAVAQNTVQVRRHVLLLQKDAQANKVQNPPYVSKKDLAYWIYGGDQDEAEVVS